MKEMKKIAIISFTIIVVMIIGMFFIREKEDKKELPKVGFILNGKINDHTWGQSHYEGMEKCANKLGLEVIYKESVPETEECMEVIEELVSQGCEIIICNSFGFGQWELEAANNHPELHFYHASGVMENHNMATYFGRIYQMRYLSGIVAGLQTETNQIGYVASFNIPEVVRGIDAFTLGVREVNKDATVYVTFSQSWIDEEINREYTEKLLDKYKDIDVLTMHNDAISPLEVAEARGIWAIGYDRDNSDMFPNTYLTAPIWQWENFYEPHISELLKGNFLGKHYWEGLDTGIVALAPFTKNVKQGIEAEVEVRRKKMIDGTFDVFYGPIVDNEGNIRVEKGLSMSDDAMLNDLTWFVEGVVVDE